MPILHRLISLLQISDLSKVTKRFVLPVLCSLFLTILLIGQIFEIFDKELTSTVVKLSFSFSAAFYAFTALKLFSESRGWSVKKYFSFSALSFFIILLIAFGANPYGTFLLGSGLFLLISAAPFLNKESDNFSYCNFSCALSNGIFFSLLAAAILSLGSCAILASIHYLFGLDISSKVYFSLSVLYFIFFAPLYFLSGIKQDSDNKNYLYPRGIKFITNFILIPLLTTYSIILYAYIIKISILMELPKGVLAIMILSFGSFGVLTHFFSYPLAKESNKLVRVFSQYFYHSLLIPLGFLFFAILKRVNEYGVTEDRYLIILMGLWLLISCIHTIYTKAKNLKFVTVCLAVMFIATSFGPWGIVGFSEFSQVKRLENLLKRERVLVDGKIIRTDLIWKGTLSSQKEGILVDGKIVKTTEQSCMEISGIVEYISKTHKLKAIRKWFPKGGYVASLDDNVKFINPQEVMKDMGLQYFTKWQKIAQNTIYFSIKDQQDFGKAVMDLKGFDYAVVFDLSSGASSKDFKNQSEDLVFSLSLEENNIIVTENNKIIGKIELTNFVNHLRTSKQESGDFVLEIKSEVFEGRLYTTSIRAELLDKPEIRSIRALLLIKKLR